jgi:CubicO group peptidase (beta-lactamase class C family)
MARIVFLLLAAAAAATPVRADHDTAATILSAWQRFAPRLHVLQPAKSVRTLAPSTDKAAIDRISADARAFLSDQMAVVVVENGELIFEAYANGAAKDSPLQSYSMAKSLTALAVGEALCAGKLKSLDDKASLYEPALEGTAYGASSVRNLLRYTSGAQDPGGNGYVGIHNSDDFRAVIQQRMSLLDLMKKYGEQSRFKQGEKFIYNGLDSQTLGVVVRGATGMPLQRWFEETVWQKAGAEHTAGWYMDRDGNGIAEILVLATARDYARIGLYVLDRLRGKADEPCVSGFLREAATAQVRKGYWDAAPSFGLGLHVGADGNTWIFGHGGQRIGINAKTGRVFATNGYKDWRNLDTSAQGLLAR